MRRMSQFFRSLKEIRKYIRRKPSQNVVKVCPICLAEDLEIVPNAFLPFISPPNYICRQCGYAGIIFAEIAKDEYAKLKSTDETNPNQGE